MVMGGLCPCAQAFVARMNTCINQILGVGGMRDMGIDLAPVGGDRAMYEGVAHAMEEAYRELCEDHGQPTIPQHHEAQAWLMRELGV